MMNLFDCPWTTVDSKAKFERTIPFRVFLTALIFIVGCSASVENVDRELKSLGTVQAETNSAESNRSQDNSDPATNNNDAEVLLRETVVKAATAGRKTFVIIDADWCSWCKKLERFLEVNSELFSEYEIITIDRETMVHGEQLSKHLINGRDGGLPWTVILDKDAKEIACSVGSTGNVGYPVSPAEVGHFIEMIRLSSEKSPEQLDEIKTRLVNFEKDDAPEECSLRKTNCHPAPISL